jgi:hypothetical protein
MRGLQTGVKRKRRCRPSRRATARAATLISGPPAMVALLRPFDALEVAQAVIAGHDWGAPIACPCDRQDDPTREGALVRHQHRHSHVLEELTAHAAH